MGQITIGKGQRDGLEVRVSISDDELPPERQPTRYQQHLRRQAANRARHRAGLDPLPSVRAGTCEPCAGWGVVQKGRRCPACGGAGE